PIPQPVLTAAEAEREAILRAGWACRGNVTRMARELEIGRTTLWRKMKRFNISPDHFRSG
ncbi:MAG: helix-turn-helix domain-containing protein, partial [Anaerolineae bacterium]|nr:helix-turn-helix domain-containing protein [Anaerolineae bacterium]